MCDAIADDASTAATAATPATETNNIFEQGNQSRYLRRFLQANVTTTSAPKSFDRVQFLELSFNNLKGSIPEEFSLLKELVFLDLKDNALMGTIPPLVFDSLVHLMEFNVRNNGLGGILPAAIGKWSDLALFDVSRNQQWSNHIPSEMGLLSALYWLDLSYNKFSGSLPMELSQLGLLQRLGLRGNRFNSTLPPAFGNLTTLQHLDAGQNSFSGPIAAEWQSMAALTILKLDSNNLSGVVPPQIGPPFISLKELDVTNNPLLTGAIPQQLCYIDSLNFTCNPDEGALQLCGCGCGCGNSSDVTMPPSDLTTPGPETTNATTNAPTTSPVESPMEMETNSTVLAGNGTVADPVAAMNDANATIAPSQLVP